MAFKTKIVEFFGLPRTGKTILINLLRKLLNDKGLKTEIVIERASICPIKDKLHPLFNYWTTISLMKEYIEACDKDVDIILADRGVLDSLIWINYFNKEKNYKKEYEYFKSLANNEFITDNYIISFFFTADIDYILKKEYKIDQRAKEGRIVNKHVLKKYKLIYESLRENIWIDKEIIEIEVDFSNFDNILNKIYEHILVKFKN